MPFIKQLYRNLSNELIRISSHFLALTTSAMDIGAVTPFLWVFEEREELATIFENITGARIHTSLFKLGGLNYTFSYTDLIINQGIYIKS